MKTINLYRARANRTVDIAKYTPNRIVVAYVNEALLYAPISIGM
jgi:hypothetical protein